MAFKMKGSPMARNYGAPFKDDHKPPLVLEAEAKRAAEGKKAPSGPETMSDAEEKAFYSENRKKVEGKTGKKFSPNYESGNYDTELPLISDAAKKRDQDAQNAYDEMMDKE
tara:strand:+ start:227 stop:559 length:333 start_codon:yes stop_codon:yes gene_type:complete